jgi:hypothetical protein
MKLQYYPYDATKNRKSVKGSNVLTDIQECSAFITLWAARGQPRIINSRSGTGSVIERWFKRKGSASAGLFPFLSRDSAFNRRELSGFAINSP